MIQEIPRVYRPRYNTIIRLINLEPIRKIPKLPSGASVLRAEPGVGKLQLGPASRLERIPAGSRSEPNYMILWNEVFINR